jgi:hypothetical protein
MVKDEEIVCKNCGWHWKLSKGGKDPYTCHKCKDNNKEMIKLKDILNEIISEMGVMTIKPILDLYDKKPELVSKAIFPYAKKIFSKEKIEKELEEMDRDLFFDIMKELGLEIQESSSLEEACWDGYRKDGMKKKGNRMVPNCVRVSETKNKVNPAYLTKDASQMKKDIEKRKSLKSDDPAAYGKWDADYADKAMTKKYKTRKSSATVAYEKRFGKKND